MPASQLADSLVDCPSCQGHFQIGANLLESDGVLSLSHCLEHRDQRLNVLGLILGLAVRDGASEIRLVGRKPNEESQPPLG